MKGVDLLNEKKLAVTKTEHKIGKTTYIICSSFSDKATDNLDKKIEKLIRKDIEENVRNQGVL